MFENLEKKNKSTMTPTQRFLFVCLAPGPYTIQKDNCVQLQITKKSERRKIGNYNI